MDMKKQEQYHICIKTTEAIKINKEESWVDQWNQGFKTNT